VKELIKKHLQHYHDYIKRKETIRGKKEKGKEKESETKKENNNKNEREKEKENIECK
jgi:hypothetical protein